MKRIISGLVVVMLLFILQACTPNIKLRYDGVHKVPNYSGTSITYVYVIDKDNIKILSGFKGSDEEAVNILLDKDKIKTMSYSEMETSIYMRIRHGNLSGSLMFDKIPGGTFKRAFFLKIEDGKIVKKYLPGELKPE